MVTRWTQNGPWDLERLFGHSNQILLNKLFDSSTPSMRKVDNGGKEKKKRKEKIILFIVATNVVVNRPNADQLEH